MNNKAKIHLKIRDFYNKYKKVIFIILIIWTSIFVINRFLKDDFNANNTPSTTYNPHTSVMNQENVVPEKLQQPIEDLIKQYVTYCNNAEYENAYNMLTDECKTQVFGSLKNYEEYIKKIFGTGGKIYNIQDFSNLDNTYIYNVRILDDILANGTTNGYGYYEEKITITGTNSNDLKLNVANFVASENLTIFAEDDYLRIEILGKNIEYDKEIYRVKFTNKSEYPIVLANNREEFEIGIYIGDQTRQANLPIANLVVQPNSSQTIDLEFTKFADDGRQTSLMIFNAIRILQSYSGSADKYEKELNEAIKLYSLTLNL